MNVVSELCDRIAFLKEGKILKVDTQENFKKMITDKLKIQLKVSSKKELLVNALQHIDYISEIDESNEIISFLIKNEQYYPNLLNILKDFPIIQINEMGPSLDDVFIKLTK